MKLENGILSEGMPFFYGLFTVPRRSPLDFFLCFLYNSIVFN